MTRARGTRLTPSTSFLVASGALTLAYFFLPPGARAPIYLILSAGAAFAAFTAARAGVEQRLPWSLLSAGLLLWTAGDVVWWSYIVVGSEPPYPSIADVFYFLGYPAVVAAGVALVHRIRPRAATGTISAAAAAVGFGLVLWAAAIGDGGGPLWERVVAVASPTFDGVVLGTIILIAIGTAALATRTIALLVIGFIALLAADTGYALLLVGGAYEEEQCSTPGG